MMDGVFISMRLCHPSADVARLCENFGLKPRRAWLAGQSREAPTGLALEGTYPSSYCACDLPIDQATYLEEGLEIAAKMLKSHAAALNQFSQDGGRISFFVSLEKGVFQGAELSPGLLAELAELHVFLEIDRDF